MFTETQKKNLLALIEVGAMAIILQKPLKERPGILHEATVLSGIIEKIQPVAAPESDNESKAE